MKTSKLFLLPAFAFFFCANLQAQVTIGGLENPKDGAILDLNSTVKGGLVLSNVNLDNLSEIPASFPDVSGIDAAILKAGMRGSVIYNTNPKTCVGVHVWNGNFWERVASGTPEPAQGISLSITSGLFNQVGGDVIGFAATPGAKIYRWYASLNYAPYEYIGLTTTETFSTTFPPGTNSVKVVMDDCQSLKVSNEVTFAPDALSPGFGGVGGGNYIYVYGDFPYAATSEYESDGLVAHYDGVNNTGLGDKYHSGDNAIAWTNLKTKESLDRNAKTPTGDGGWKLNGWKVTGDAGFWSNTIPAGIPVGTENSTIEIIYTTPAGGVPIPDGYNERKGLFGYGNLTTGVFMQRRSFQYDNMLFAPDNWACNVRYTQSGYPDLFVGNKLISLAVSSEGGQALATSIAYFNGVMATPSFIDECIPDITTGQFYLGGYDPAQVYGYVSAPAWTIHSLRIYNEVLTPAQVAHNSSLDQKRYLSPPTVKIGGNFCSEVIVLSEHFLICKAPGGSIGPADVEVNGFTYTDAYEYVDNSSFYITGFSPILSPVSGGGVLTLTGNKLDKISKVEIGGTECPFGSKTNDEYQCTIPSHANAEEVDIVITFTDGDDSKVYRFAKVFEFYQPE